MRYRNYLNQCLIDKLKVLRLYNGVIKYVAEYKSNKAKLQLAVQTALTITIIAAVIL